jgi:hypothetical protein
MNSKLQIIMSSFIFVAVWTSKRIVDSRTLHIIILNDAAHLLMGQIPFTLNASPKMYLMTASPAGGLIK